MAQTAEQTAIGRRMREAANQAGMNPYQIAPRIGVKPNTIYRWWDGERTPSSQRLIAYARLVGKPVGAFYEPEKGAAPPPGDGAEAASGSGRSPQKSGMPETWDQALMGQRMKTAALEAGLNQMGVAQRLGVASPTVCRWWSGERDPPSGTLLAYAQLVGRPVGYFFGRDEEAEAWPRELAALLLGCVQLLRAAQTLQAALDHLAQWGMMG